jgi:hypothetical protein
MDLSLIALGTSIAIIIVGEWLLWGLFKTRVRSLQFPHETDQSDLHFFTIARLRICALLHALLLLGIATITFLFLW